jgi:hypothetical protein
MEKQCGLLIPRREQNQPGEGRSSMSNNCWLALHRFLKQFPETRWLEKSKGIVVFLYPMANERHIAAIGTLLKNRSPEYAAES